MNNTGFDRYWENAYSKGKMLNKYPFDLVVSIVFRCFGNVSNREEIRILDLGCGAGNHSWFFSREGFSVVGIDASESAIKYLKERLESEGLSADLHVLEFHDIDKIKGEFDFILDRQSLSMTDFDTVNSTIKKIPAMLKPNGLFLSFFYNKAHPAFVKYGGTSINGTTFYDIPGIGFSGAKLVSLLDAKTHSELFSEFNILECYEHYINPIIENNKGSGISEFVTLATKS